MRNKSKISKLKMLWNIYLDYYYNMDPKAGLEDWEEVFNDFLKKPDETLAYWKHYTSFDIPADESKWDEYEYQWEIKLDKLADQLPYQEPRHAN